MSFCMEGIDGLISPFRFNRREVSTNLRDGNAGTYKFSSDIELENLCSGCMTFFYHELVVRFSLRFPGPSPRLAFMKPGLNTKTNNMCHVQAMLHANGVAVKENSICLVSERFLVSSCSTISSWLYGGTLISVPLVSRFKHGVPVGLCIF